MKPRPLLHSVILFAPLVPLTGCVGFNTALFMTKSNAGLDFDAKPPTVEINISRKEAVGEPSFEGGKTPTVMASFSSKSGSGGGLGRFFFGVDQTFAGGDAALTMAKLYDTNGIPEDNHASRMSFDSGVSLSKPPRANTPAGKKGWLGLKKHLFALPEPGEVRPFFFGTDSQLGVKVAWNGVGGPYPDNVKIGYNRKEMAVAPVTFTPREDEGRSNVVRIPSFLATVDSKVEGGGDVQVGWLQYFATGESASYLARQPGVRIAMHERADPKAAEQSGKFAAFRIAQESKYDSVSNIFYIFDNEPEKRSRIIARAESDGLVPTGTSESEFKKQLVRVDPNDAAKSKKLRELAEFAKSLPSDSSSNPVVPTPNAALTGTSAPAPKNTPAVNSGGASVPGTNSTNPAVPVPATNVPTVQPIPR